MLQFFANRTIGLHLARGLAGGGVLVTCYLVSDGHPMITLALLPVWLFLLKGCPMCWTIGLIVTVRNQFRAVRGEAPVSGCPADVCGRPA